MPPSSIHVCQCPSCESGPPHLDQERHRQMNLLISRLDEQQRRWYAALESTRLGHGGDEQIFRIMGLDPQTIRRGRRELATDLSERPGPRIRAPGAGRPRAEKRSADRSGSARSGRARNGRGSDDRAKVGTQ